MKIAVLSYADVDNYGDIFFPFIVCHELRRLLPGCEVELYSSTGGEIEGTQFSAYTEERIDGRYDAIIIAGGEVIHTEDLMLNWIFGNLGLTIQSSLPTDIVFDWPRLRTKFRAWHAVGMPEPSPSTVDRVRRTAPQLDYVAFRGELSRKHFEACGVASGQATIVNDIGWLIPDVASTVATPTTRLPKGEYLVFHTLQSCLGDSARTTFVADTLQAVEQRLGLRVVLLPITRCWQDSTALSEIHDRSGGRLTLLPNDYSIYETASVLVHARASVTSSMHGAITSLAAGVPSAVVYLPQQSKFSELLASVGLSDLLLTDWQALPTIFDRLLATQVDVFTRLRDTEPARTRSQFSHLAMQIAQHVTGKLSL